MDVIAFVPVEGCDCGLQSTRGDTCGYCVVLICG